MSTPLYNSLGLNFNMSKFGDALDPKGNMDEVVLYTQPLLTKWQYDAVLNNETSTTLYLKNPLANVVNSISITANNIYNSANTYLYLANANSASANLVTAANNFFRHTQRISGVETSSNLAIPDYSMAMGFGQQAQTLISKFEGVANNSVILGSMTSLFVEDDLLIYSVKLDAAYTDLVNSVIFVSGLPGYYVSNLSQSRISEIVGLLTEITTFMDTRRNHDVTYYGKIRNLSNNVMNIMKFSGFTDLGAHLVDKYIGTDKLKEKL